MPSAPIVVANPTEAGEALALTDGTLSKHQHNKMPLILANSTNSFSDSENKTSLPTVTTSKPSNDTSSRSEALSNLPPIETSVVGDPESIQRTPPGPFPLASLNTGPPSRGATDSSRTTLLQQHCLFWDRDMDGQIWPRDTYVGFRELGFSVVFSVLAMVIINAGFSYPTRLATSFLPDPFFRVWVNGLYKAKHGSDTGVYDIDGHFVPQKFEDLFSRWDGDGDGALKFWELVELGKRNRLVFDPFGWGAEIFEWGTTWLLIQKNGKVYKEDVRGIYDGSIFWRVRDAYRSKKGWSQGWGPRDMFQGWTKKVE